MRRGQYVYATGSSGRGEKGPRTAEYLRNALSLSRQNADGIRVYCLPKSDPNDYWFSAVAELFGKWSK